MQTDDTYRDTATDAADRYDFSENSRDHPLYDVSNSKALGFFKDELNYLPMQEFVGLRPKCYAFLCTGKVDNNVHQHTRPVCGEEDSKRCEAQSERRSLAFCALLEHVAQLPILCL